ncbi:MAG: ATP-binding protein [Phycisphaerae bacterium]|nr:ATP-binding protein [Phycisphaerae bacterium]
MSQSPEIKIEFRSNPAYLCAIREMVNLLSRRCGFSDGAANKIALAVDEALANVMNHGYEKRTDLPIWLSISRRESGGVTEGFRIVIEDEGRQVEPEQIKSRDLADIRPGGLGVHIIREVMDSVKYEKREGGMGMRLTLEKKLDPGESAPNRGCCERGGPCA